jgi:hypothetical protein
MGLTDYDERMAVLIQEVQGRRTGHFFLPDSAGVAMSRNQYRWSPRIDRHAGFLRLVWGLGTRAVEQLGGDYPRLVALSHPDLRPEMDPARIARFSQGWVDLIDLEANAFRTLPIEQVIAADTPALRWIAQRYQGEHLAEFVSLPLSLDPKQVVLTFDGLLRHTDFPHTMQHFLERLERAYLSPVDTEFTVHLEETASGVIPVITLLQCRPQSHFQSEGVQLPDSVPSESVIFITQRLVPDGQVADIRYAVYVSPEGYAQLAADSDRREIARLIGRINARMAGHAYILLGPGRWGSNTPSLGIPVSYSEIHNARALVEVEADQYAPDPSYGTHFFQDLVEARIFPLAVAVEDAGAEFNHNFFEASPNSLTEWLPDQAAWASLVRLIDIPAVSGGAHLTLVMDGEEGKAIAYLTHI